MAGQEVPFRLATAIVNSGLVRLEEVTRFAELLTRLINGQNPYASDGRDTVPVPRWEGSWEEVVARIRHCSRLVSSLEQSS